MSLCAEVSDINERDIILRFAAVFLFIKSYGSCLVAEGSQLCVKGVLRTIALGSTDGLCTWRCTFVIGFQGLIVPVGRIALGRIFNVLGSIIDRYIEFGLSSQFDGMVFCDWNTMIINTIFFLCLFYIAYLYQNLRYLNWRANYIALCNAHPCSIAASDLFKIDCSINALPGPSYAIASSSLFLNTDGLFGLIKPIHKTAVPITQLTIQLRLFETGIKVVDLLTPYKKGGKIDLFDRKRCWWR
jgi:hypothetical protein